MAQRPCKPDGDLTKLWRALLPGVAVPACGTGGNKVSDDEPAEPAPHQQTEKPSRD